MSAPEPKTCNVIKRDGYWCEARPVVFVGDYGYCARHKDQADGRGYPPVADKRPKSGRR